MFPLDEQEKVQEGIYQDISLLGGCLNKYAHSSKIEFEDKAWELHVMDKYK